MDPFLSFSDDVFLKKERAKARVLRSSQWWKRRCDSGVCHYCRGKFSPGELTMDHVIPLARGGRSEKFNLVPCCKECNTKKRQLLPSEWADYMDTLKP